MSRPSNKAPLKLHVNGRDIDVQDIPDDMMLVDVLHEYLGLTGTRFGCGQGECRACTVIVDDANGPREVRSCITGAHWFEGKRIRTVEGHAKRDEGGNITTLSPVQRQRCGSSASVIVASTSVLLIGDFSSFSSSTVAALTKPGVQ